MIAGEIDRAVAPFARPLARYLARIFQGASAGDLPIEMPTHFELAINFRTAKALGEDPRIVRPYDLTGPRKQYHQA